MSEKLEHPHIVKVLDLCEDNKDIFIALELIKGGNLLEVLSKMQKKKIAITETDAATIVHQILLAINYIHTSKVVHRDLKLENIMVDIKRGNKGEAIMTCKLTDFGFACMMDPNEKITLSLGSPLYMAPEVIDHKSYDSKVDIWSLGVIAYIVLTGKAPFDGKSRDEIFDNAKYGKLNLSPLDKYRSSGTIVKDFITRCLDRNVERRWSADQLLEHPWFTKNVKAEEIFETELVDIGVNIYTFK